MATVTLTMEEYGTLQRRVAEAEEKVAKLTRSTAEASLNAEPLVPLLVEGFLASYKLVQFLLAHAHPDVVKSQPWPYEALLTFADTLEQLPASAHEVENNKSAAIDLRLMAKEAADWNTRRAERRARLARGEAPEPDEPTSVA